MIVIIAANINKFLAQFIFNKCMAKANKTNIMTPISTFRCFLLAFCLDSALVSIFINLEVNTGLITKATNKDYVSTQMSVIGKYFMNIPMIPGQNIKGRKAANVVAVEAIIGMATSAAPYFAANFPS